MFKRKNLPARILKNIEQFGTIYNIIINNNNVDKIDNM